MLFENVIITTISLTAGIVFGIIFSRLMFLVLMKLIKADSVPAFVISTNAVVVTIIYFISIFAVIFIYNFVKVQMSKPIELLHSDEIGEKEPKTKLIMTILGLLCLGGGYYFALTVSSILKAVQYFFVAALFVVIGTYLLFTAGSIALLKLLRKNKKVLLQDRTFYGCFRNVIQDEAECNRPCKYMCFINNSSYCGCIYCITLRWNAGFAEYGIP
mgnify:CR=1 FL=1